MRQFIFTHTSGPEPPRFFRRPFCVSHAANAVCSLWRQYAASALVAATGVPRTQDGMDASARLEERLSVTAAAQAQRARLEQRQRMARAGAHARMPNTMYASTLSLPDTAPSWHPVLVEPDTEGGGERLAPPATSAQTSGSAGTHRIPLFASASDPLGRRCFARVINHSEVAGEARIDAFDDAGKHYGPLTPNIVRERRCTSTPATWRKATSARVF